jgi:hypothetical protein
MFKLFVPSPTNQNAPGHTQMHNPLRLIDRFVSRLRFPSARSQQVDHNVLAYPAHSADLRSFQRKHDLTGRRVPALLIPAWQVIIASTPSLDIPVIFIAQTLQGEGVRLRNSLSYRSSH